MSDQKNTAVYFGSLELEGVPPFSGTQTLNLTMADGRPSMVNVILGSNGTGKTTLLKTLLASEPVLTFRGSIIQSISSELLESSEEEYPLTILPRNQIRRVVANFHTIRAKFLLLKNGQIEVNQLTSANFEDSIKIHRDLISYGIMTKSPEVPLRNLEIVPYSATRVLGSHGLKEISHEEHLARFFNNLPLPNAEEWFLQMDYAHEKAEGEDKKRAKNILNSIKQILVDILPDVSDIKAVSKIKNLNQASNYLECSTPYGQVRLRDLSHGYQTMFGWVLDLARRMFERYPESSAPLKEPGVCLVDEIDLHLHPTWQQNIVRDLVHHFPNVQFIFTSHSPLIVQSIADMNLAILQRGDDGVHIRNMQNVKFTGWSVEEILQDLMDLEEPFSEEYDRLTEQFTEGINEDDAGKVREAYRGLSRILHPESPKRQWLRFQLPELSEEIEP